MAIALLSMGGAMICVTLPVTAAAQTGGIEEVVVTASKRATGLRPQDMGSSISVVTARTLEDAGIVNLDALVSLVPGLNIESYGPGDSEYIIRGINAAGESTVGVYFDESPISGRFEQDGGGKNAAVKLIDIERIEVLKGPQGSLFGANSMSGTVRIITNKPDLQEFQGRTDANFGMTRYSSDENYQVSGVLNVPVVKNKLGVRLVVYSDRSAGFIDNTQIGVKDANDVEVNGFRGHVLFEPNPDFSLLASVTYQDLEAGHNGRVTPEGELGADGAFYINEGPENPRSAAPGGKYINTEFSHTGWDEDLWLLSLTGELNTAAGVITATTSYYDREILRFQDSTPVNTTTLAGLFNTVGFSTPPAGVLLQPQDREITTVELRYASDFDLPVQLVAGGFYQRETSNFDSNVLNVNSDGRPVEAFMPSAPTIVTGAGEPGELNSIFGRYLDGKRERLAFFGEATYEVTPEIELVGGMRWFRFEIEEEQNNTGPDFLAGNDPFSVSGNETTVTWKVNLAYKPTDEETYYALVSTGFRPGSTNVAAGIAGIAGGVDIPPTFDSDSLRNHEVGAKLQLWDRRVNMSMAAFWLEWEDIQVQTITEGGFNFIDNAGKARVLGLETEAQVYFYEHWTANFGLTYTDAQLTQDQPLVVGPSGASFTGRDGDSIPKTPEFTAVLGVSYRFQVAEWENEIRADYYHKSDSRSDFSRTDAVLGVDNQNYRKLPSTDTININANFTKGNVTLGLYAMNVTDEYIVVDVLSSDQDPFAYIIGRPRTIGARVGVEF
ncbi:TonB-dependent receptor [Kineobactrum salinum]|uniref:TonB-dependent receptor n=1 Tax=Kineobactrum salinum TaxID=2708301 RepID=A0A6C0TZI4_9GAMM|nr:TonB-dependent receptor [Kineobactrum salinum]QIB64107.1 TonB-dependent receptor [Kineobactrum salinum]